MTKRQVERAAVAISKQISDLINNNGTLTVLTGAGISTDSGIPDYRGPQGTYTIQRDYKPITYQAFMKSHETRQRYWARSFLGYPWMSTSQPNISHKVLAWMQNQFQVGNLGCLLMPEGHLITQNVDSLHLRAGSRGVVELHGSLRSVVCMTCGRSHSRDWFQQQLVEMNPKWNSFHQQQLELIENYQLTQQRLGHERIEEEEEYMLNMLGVKRVERIRRPDGDLDLNDKDYTQFKFPACSQSPLKQDNHLGCDGYCKGGILKPDVVFFGENLKPEVRDDSFKAVDDCDHLLVIGTSLEVFSAYRLVKRALDLTTGNNNCENEKKKKKVTILNIGQTRASDDSRVQHFQLPCGPVLQQVAHELNSFGG
jgi:NAD+-dependent protein deacetylase sirtuin 4